MTPGECRWCVRVTCQHDVIRSGMKSFRCRWSGYRPKKMTGHRRNCPWCNSTGAFVKKPVFHRMGTACPFSPLIPY
jgi:hypothetical protein